MESVTDVVLDYMDAHAGILNAAAHVAQHRPGDPDQNMRVFIANVMRGAPGEFIDFLLARVAWPTVVTRCVYHELAPLAALEASDAAGQHV